MKHPDPASQGQSVVRTCIFVVLVVAGAVLVDHVDLPWDVRNLAQEGVRSPLILTAVLSLYVALLAVPFVPGAELGLLLMVVFGADMAVPVYLATVAALMLSFSIGRFVPDSVRSAMPTWLGMHRNVGGRPVARIGASDGGVSNPWIRGFLKHRRLALIVLINTPGNSVLGGGGGIAMAAGISRLFTFRAFMISVAVAVAPVPLAVGILTWFDCAVLGARLHAVSGLF